MYWKNDCIDCKDKSEANIYLEQLWTEFAKFMEGSSFRCKVCNKTLANNNEVLNHTISEHEAKIFTEKKISTWKCVWKQNTNVMSISNLFDVEH